VIEPEIGQGFLDPSTLLVLDEGAVAAAY